MKRSTSSTRKPAKKTSAAAKTAKKSGGRKAGGTPKERKPKRKAGGTPKERKPKRKAGGTPKERKPKRKAGGTPKERKPKKKKKKTAARAVAAKSVAAKSVAAKATPAKAAPAKKPPARKKGAARRAATAVMDAAKTVAAVVSAPVRAVAAAVAGPSAEPPQDSAGAGNGADSRSSGGDDATMVAADPVTLIGRIESAYGVTLPDRYRRFLRDGEYTRYPRIELAGYIRGPYDLDFVDDLLPDVSELGQNAGIYDMDDVPWSDDYAGYVPLASLSHPDVDEPKVFLVHQVGGDQHRVLLFDYEGWRLYPLAENFESFLAGLPKATNDITTAFRPGA